MLFRSDVRSTICCNAPAVWRLRGFRKLGWSTWQTWRRRSQGMSRQLRSCDSPTIRLAMSSNWLNTSDLEPGENPVGALFAILTRVGDS